MKNILKYLAIGLTTLVVLGVLSFLYLKSTPQYALYELGQAFTKHDLTAVQRRLDIDGIATQLGDAVGRYLQKEADKPSTATNEWEAAGESWGKSLVQLMIPGIVTKAKDAFAQGLKDAASGKATEVGKDVAYKSLTWKDLFPHGRITVTKSGADRLVTVTLDDKKFVFKMSRVNKDWKIVSWENVDEQLSAVTAMNDEEKADDQKAIQNVQYDTRVATANGWYITVSAPATYVPANEFSQAEKGKKFVAIDVLYENTGTKGGSYDPSNFELQDTESHRYKREYSGKEPTLESGELMGGEKVRGYLTYEVPDSVSDFSVRYSSSAAGTIIFGK